MPSHSRRSFLAGSLALPAAAAAQSQASNQVKLAFRMLGKTGLKVTSLSFGCMTTSDASVIERAVDTGIVHFDTARIYQNGNNERMVGAALKGKRDKVVLSSKTQGKTRSEALADLDTSLKELQTDHLDIWYLHAKQEPADVTDDLLEAQRIAKKDGKIRFAGVSTHFNMDRMLPYLVKLGQTDVVLTTYNFAMRSVAVEANKNPDAPKTDMTAIIQQARKAGMGIVVMKALAGGTSRVQRGDRLYGANPEALSKQLIQPGVPLAAIKWVLKNEAVDTTIVCMTDHEQFEENVRAMAEPYGDKDEQILNARLAAIGPDYCRMCGTCGGVCDKGVPVPEVLRVLTYAEGYGQFALARERFLQIPEKARAVRCGDCGSCSIACQHGVRIRERVGRAQELLA
jgi:predicted aldo/keto reductase-like oxidoreductase